jgi:hypothetical protein
MELTVQTELFLFRPPAPLQLQQQAGNQENLQEAKSKGCDNVTMMERPDAQLKDEDLGLFGIEGEQRQGKRKE